MTQCLFEMVRATSWQGASPQRVMQLSGKPRQEPRLDAGVGPSVHAGRGAITRSTTSDNVDLKGISLRPCVEGRLLLVYNS